ncbi:MAG TPA: AMP-binding protein [Acidimicrobiales bacterium]|nr:AMP-binding protein [Acidimicrobiales bacterium]
MTLVADLRARSHADLLAKLPAHAERVGWDAARIRAHQEAGLRTLLAHAHERSPWHRARIAAAGVDPATATLADLPRLPVMRKPEMMAHYDEVVTDPRLTRAAVEDHLQQVAAAGGPLRFLAGDHVVLASGGSSGVRGVFAWRWDALTDLALGCLRRSLLAARALGPPPGGFPYALVAAPSAVHATRAMAELFSGTLIDVHAASATWPLARIVAAVEAARPLALTAYPSVLVRLAEERRAGRLDAAPLAVTGSSEAFPPEARAAVAEAFGVAPANVYGTTEGLGGSAQPGEDPIDLATDMTIVELVDAAGRPVPPGVAADRALITNLANLAQPLVRYELTDRMLAHPPAPDHGYLRVSVEGRADEVLAYGAVTVEPIVLRAALARFPGVAEYQVRQTARGADVDAVPAGPCDEGSVGDEVAAALAAAGVDAPRVRVRLVEAIARDPATGKARRIVPRP